MTLADIQRKLNETTNVSETLKAVDAQPQDNSMTLTQIAQTFPPMHHWTRDQERTVAKAIQAIVGQTFVCTNPLAMGIQATVVEKHPHSMGCTVFLYSPSKISHQNHGCDIFHFVENYTPVNPSSSETKWPTNKKKTLWDGWSLQWVFCSPLPL